MSTKMAKPNNINPHVLMVPLPVQGHVIPLLELAQRLAKHSITITFVNTDFIHHRIVNSFDKLNELDDRIRMVSVPDGLGSEDRLIPGKMTEMVYKIMPKKIEELVRKNNLSEEGKIRCVIYDQSIGVIYDVAKRLGVGTAAFLPAAVASLVLSFSIPKLIEDGVVDDDGTPLKHETVQFAPTMPIMTPSDFVWSRLQILTVQKQIFNIMRHNNKPTQSADQLICNSTYDLEPGALALAPQVIPIGPLLATTTSQGHFWKQDLDCLNWLHQQQPSSVIYIAFGSSTIFNQAQFQELAIGLEKSNRPFLWVVRPDTTFGPKNRASLTRGRIINWAPQQMVLSHFSIAGFISHCGWNSTVESVSNGVPILCWPYFADQFINQSYICDVWKVGLKIEKDSNGTVTSEEIEKKIDQLLGNNVFKERALELKEKINISAREEGDSYTNMRNFISWIKRSN